MPLVLSHTNNQGVATCQSVVSCSPRASLYVYKGAQVVLFSLEPKGMYVYVKVRRRIFMQYRANNCREGCSGHKPPSNEIPSPRELISGGSEGSLGTQTPSLTSL